MEALEEKVGKYLPGYSDLAIKHDYNHVKQRWMVVFN